MGFLEKGFLTVGLKGEFKLGLLDSQYVLIHFALAEDYHKCWMHKTWNFRNHIMKVLKWGYDFSPDWDPLIVPVWIFFKKLPIHFFQKSPLLSLAGLIEKLLKVDVATQNLSWFLVARVCVEVNLLKLLSKYIWIGQGETDF